MAANKTLFFLQEFLWLVMAFAVASFVVYPLYSKLNYIFLAENFVFAVSAVVLLRMVFFFNHIVWLKPRWVRFVLGALALNYVVIILNIEQNFLYAHDSFNISDLGEPRKELSMQEIEKLFHYFHTETHFIVVCLLVLLALFVIRLISSYWSLAKTRLYTDNKKFEVEK